MDTSEAEGGQEEERSSVTDFTVNTMMQSLNKEEKHDGHGQQPENEDEAATHSDRVASPVISRFEIDVNQIESVKVENQDTEIQSLGLTVYNQSSLERGIWDQVEAEGWQEEERSSVTDFTVNTMMQSLKEEEKHDGHGQQPENEDEAATHSDRAASPVISRFEVDVNQIESVKVENQDIEIQSLGLTVYNQSTLERGIWDQVERETRKREAQEELANVASKLKLAEEQLKRVESAKGKKRSILQEALEEPSKRKPHSLALKKHQELSKDKLKELRSKKAALQAQLKGTNISKGSEAKQESERDRKIRMGEMTPFGTSLGASSSDLSSFEKYLKSQQELHKKMIGNGASKTRKKQGTSQLEGKKSDKSFKQSTSNKIILKKKVLFPKRRKPKEKLGTDTSIFEEDQHRSPGSLPGENLVVDLENSGSEYFPSGSDEDNDFYPQSQQKKSSSPGSALKEVKEISPPKNTSKSDRWAGGSLKRRKKYVKEMVDGDPEDWCSDDSDWICTDDEDFNSDDNNCGRKIKKSSRRDKDDGNSEDFFRRIKQWEKQNEGLREQMDNDVHEFENGYKLPCLIWDKLYMYQQVGVRWMWELNQQRCGGILGDEMGLGKTIQIISFLAGLSISKLKCRTTGYRGLGPTLIVCPTTVMHQWVREFHTWFPPLRVSILHESGSYIGKRSQLVRDMLHERAIVITSYTAVVRLKDFLLHQRWHYVILDEGHKIRNPDAQVTLAVKQLRTPHRLILSGSPLQNHLRELWSLMDFVFPGKLGTLPVFMSEFAVPINQGGYSNASEVMVATAYKCATVLRDTISPYLLRRMKADVSDHIKLPSKNEQVLFCRLTDEQREIYKEYLQCGEVGRILEGRCQIFVGLINLRKICNHPHLFSGGPKLFAHEKEEDIREEERFGYWEKAGKMVVIEALLKMWQKQEHRVLIFTQSRQMLLIIEKFVNDRGYRYLKMDGGTSIAARQPLIKKFNEDKSYFLMLLTTKVGGLGVNLTGANRVVIYDPDWNPATDTQARERAWRIGQQNAVTVYRLITAGTIEEKMYHRQIFKQFLCNKVLKDPRQRRFFKSNDLLELFTLKETDDGTTETSAIFAGTNSQVHVKPKHDSQRNIKDKKQSYSHSSHRENQKKYEVYVNTGAKVPGKLNKYKSPTKISFSQDKMDHMKKLAHELSLKLASKVTATSKENVEDNQKSTDQTKVAEKSEGPIVTVDCTEAIDKNAQAVADIGKHDDGIKNIQESINKNDTDSSNPEEIMTDVTVNALDGSGSQIETILSCSEEPSLTGLITADDSDDDLESMKHLAQELSGELLQKVQAAAAINRPVLSGRNSDIGSNVPDPALIRRDESNDLPCVHPEPEENHFVDLSSSKSEEHLPVVLSAASDKTQSSSHGLTMAASSSYNQRQRQKSTKGKCDESPSSSKHKKRKKHKKHKHKDALFEGERVRGLVKSSTLEEKSREEMNEEASHNAKQDDYVLRKLFSKTGIKTAMQHERIMESGHADYTIVEGEARRVAQEAVRAMKASRQQCWTAMSGQPTWTGASGRVRVPEDGASRSQEEGNRPQPSRPKFGKKKLLSKKANLKVSKESDAEEGGSSTLLARIRARNLLLTENDDDGGNANTISGVSSNVSDSSRELLDDIRTFVSFGASVEGRATTDEIVSQFHDRLPAQSSALFKQMLMQICEFHRLPSGQGVWKLIQEFSW